MTASNLLITLVEIAFGGVIIWGFWHEEKIVAWENKLFKKLGFKVREPHRAKITQFGKASNSTKDCI